LLKKGRFLIIFDFSHGLDLMVCEKKSIFQKRSFKRTGTFSDPVGGENEINDSTGPAGKRADFAVPLCRG
jgi:hypothetical protein